VSNSLYIVSNRLPITVRVDKHGIKVERSSGGLASGLSKVHAQGNSFWIGHSGVFEGEAALQEVEDRLIKDRLITVPLAKEVYDAYYNGMSNNAIWPLFHYFPASMKFSYTDWRSYQTVNELFAKKVLEHAQDGDRIWVHDYQLMLLPNLLRESGRDLRIAYFHHIPFPSSEIFRTLPRREEILDGLTGADYIGFHNYDYVRHFLSSVQRVQGSDVHLEEIHMQDRLVKVEAHPLGVDFEGIQKTARAIGIQRHDGLRTLLGIDRLDYTKGIVERLTAFGQFLEQNPEYVGKATFIQLSVPSRTNIQSYENLRSAVEKLVGQLNGEFARPGYAPIQYMHRSLPFEEVLALYRQADVAVVTPLRDGLNLVCKEYIAARVEGDGVLIISEFAGAATEMGEALMVNPYDIQSVAATMRMALEMPAEEQKRRMSLLRERVRERHNLLWADAFLDSWNQYVEHGQPHSAKLIGATRREMIRRLSSGERMFIFLDNDGTLVPIAARPEMAIPQERLRECLRGFEDLGNAEVTIVTGRPRSYLDQYFAELPVNLVAEHGAFIRQRNDPEWRLQMGVEELEELKPDILRLLRMYTRFVPGSHIEQKETCIVWHYRQAELQFARAQARELYQSLQDLLGKTSLSVYHGKKTVEIRQVFTNKGYAVEQILAARGWDHEPFSTFGDDVTDEDMHRVHAEENLSVHVGKANVYAKYFVENPDDLFKLLQEIQESLRGKLRH